MKIRYAKRGRKTAGQHSENIKLDRVRLRDDALTAAGARPSQQGNQAPPATRCGASRCNSRERGRRDQAPGHNQLAQPPAPTAGRSGAVKGGEKVVHCGGGIVYHRHDEKKLNWEPGGVRSGAGVRRSGLSQESSGSSETW